VEKEYVEKINEQQNHINKQMSIFVTLTQHISYLEAELKRTSLLVDKMSIQRELCPSNLLLSFLVNEYLTG
jgi:hypothetical protein